MSGICGRIAQLLNVRTKSRTAWRVTVEVLGGAAENVTPRVIKFMQCELKGFTG